MISKKKKKKKDVRIAIESKDKNATTNDESLLQKLYYNVESPASFSSENVLYKYAKEQNPNITRLTIRKWLKKQLTYTLHRNVEINYPTRPVLVHAIDEQWLI